MAQFKLEKLGPNTTRVIRVSNTQEKAMIFNVPFSQLCDGVEVWSKGTLVQNALPFCSGDEREFLLTGITPDEWAKMFSDPGEV